MFLNKSKYVEITFLLKKIKATALDRTDGSSLEQLSMPITMYLNTIDNHLYVAEHANQRIQLWLSNASVGQTVVGGSTNNLGRLAGVRLDSHGNLYVSETIPGHRLLRWSASASNGTNGTVLLGVGTIGSNDRSLNNPRHLDIDANNEYLFVTDNGNNRIQRLSLLNLRLVAHLSSEDRWIDDYLVDLLSSRHP